MHKALWIVLCSIAATSVTAAPNERSLDSKTSIAPPNDGLPESNPDIAYQNSTNTGDSMNPGTPYNSSLQKDLMKAYGMTDQEIEPFFLDHYERPVELADEEVFAIIQQYQEQETNQPNNADFSRYQLETSLMRKYGMTNEEIDMFVLDLYGRRVELSDQEILAIIRRHQQ